MTRSRAVDPGSTAGGLPAEPDSFIGRERDLHELRSLLGERRMITLCAPGGMGKTRLAVHLGLTASADFTGVWLVDLADLGADGAASARVADRIADRLGVVAEPGRDRADTLADALGSRHLLLILDNCEHVIEAVAAAAAVLLSRCPQLRVLATSRQPLRISGETVWQVPPLTVPRAHRHDALAGDALDHDALDHEALDHEAVRLFAVRAAALRPDFRLAPAAHSDIVRVVQALDGMPLAIELAAARITVLSPKEIADRLSDRFRLLTQGDRTAPKRQRTLRAAIDWSHDLLEPQEQILFRRLAVFPGGCTLEAAERVCADGDLPAAAVFDTLTGLVDKSLLVSEQTAAGGTRYRMLETIRQYALERLTAAGEAERLARAHLDRLIDLTEPLVLLITQGSDLRPEDDPLLPIDPEERNIKAAFRWAAEHGETGRALRLAWPMAIYWAVRGRAGEAVGRLGRVLEMPGIETPGSGVPGSGVPGAGVAGPGVPRSGVPGARVPNTGVPGSRTPGSGMPGPGVPGSGVPGLGLSRVDEHVARAAGVAAFRGQLRMESGDLPGALHDAESVVDVLRTAGRPLELGVALHVAGIVRLRMGEAEAAERLLGEAIEALGDGEPWGTAVVLTDLAEAAMARGRRQDAQRLLEDAEDRFNRLGQPWGLARIKVSLGILAQQRGDMTEARRRLHEALPLAPETAVPAEAARCHIALTRLALAERDNDEARAHIAEVLRIARPSGQRLMLARALATAAELAIEDGDTERGIRLAAAAGALRHRTGGSARREDELLATAVERLGPRAEGLSREGAEMDVEDAVRLALAAPTADDGTLSGNTTPPATRNASDGGTAAGAVAGTDVVRPGGLSARELEIAALVARGRSNKAIAEELFISPATVARHVANIFTKLELNSRTRLATWALEHDLA